MLKETSIWSEGKAIENRISVIDKTQNSKGQLMLVVFQMAKLEVVMIPIREFYCVDSE